MTGKTYDAGEFGRALDVMFALWVAWVVAAAREGSGRRSPGSS